MSSSDTFVLDSYADSPQRLNELSNMISYLTSLEKDLCLVSHLPVPERILSKRVKYVIYDSSNLLGAVPMNLFSIVDDLEVRWQTVSSYHGAAVYTNLSSALRLLRHKYEWAHFVEPDINLEAIKCHLESGFNSGKNERDVKVIGYPFFAGGVGDSLHRGF